MAKEYPTRELAVKHRRKGEYVVKVVRYRKKGAPKHLPKKLVHWVCKKRKKG